MSLIQKVWPNLQVNAIRGYCLKFLDDGIKAPLRQPTAQKAYDIEKANGNTRTGEPPIGIWVPIFFALNKGSYAGLGHVAWALNHGNGWIEIHDSETRPGARAVYRSIDEVLRWFGNHGIVYLGYSLWLDGVQIAEEFTPVTTAPVGLETSGRIAAKGTATITSPSLPVCNEPTQASPAVAWYAKGQTVNYDSYIVNDGFVWISYMSNSGVRRFIAEGPNNGVETDVWMSGGV